MQDYQSPFPNADIPINVETDSEEVAVLINESLAHEVSGEMVEAAGKMNQALNREPGNPDLHFLLSRLLFHQGDLVTARNVIEKAIELKRKEPNYHKLHGDVLFEQQTYEMAAAAYNKALKLDNRLVPAMSNLGSAYLEAGNLDECRKVIERALANDASFFPARLNQAALLHRQKKHEESKAHYRQCLDAAPGCEEGWMELSALHEELQESALAQEALEEGITHCPDSVHLHFRLAQLYDEDNQPDKAAAHYQRVNEIRPDLADHYYRQSNQWMNRLEQTLAQRAADMAAKLDGKFTHHKLFMSAYLAVLDRDEIWHRHEQWDRESHQEARESQFDHTRRNSRDRLRVGYISPDFFGHAVSYFIRTVLKNHNREKFEVYCYASVKSPDAVTKELQAMTDHWRDIRYLADYDAAKMIHKDEIDILVDLSGHTRDTRVDVLTFRPAPIQATWIGYPGSSGLSEVDYWITDHHIHPEDTTEKSSETKYRLPRTWMSYEVHDLDEVADIAIRPGDEPIVFGCINHIAKLSEQFVTAIGKLLEGNPEARAIIKSIEFSDSNLRFKVQERLTALGVDRKRVTLVGMSRSRKHHFETYNRIDICLDPFPYTGGTSTADALSMGTPVVTLAGDSLRGRMSASMLHSIGRPEWIANSVDEYMALATALAESPELRGMKPTVREQFNNSDLTDGPGMARALEDAYLDMQRKKLSTGDGPG